MDLREILDSVERYQKISNVQLLGAVSVMCL